MWISWRNVQNVHFEHNKAFILFETTHSLVEDMEKASYNHMYIMNVFLKTVFAFLFFILPFSFAYAGQTDRVKGWAWSENIGWISMNCTNTDYCGTIEYGVTILGDNTTMNGYAWSSNIGWIDFSNATFNSVSGVISGTAQVLAGEDKTTDGWDGIIQLSDTTPFAYNVDVQNNSEAEGWAWGSDVVGWVSFNCSNLNTCGTVDYFVQVEPFYFEFTANGGVTDDDAVVFEENVELQWTTAGATSCTASGGAPTSWANPSSKSAGEPTMATYTVFNIESDTTFVLTCEDAAGREIVRTLPIYVLPPSPRIIMTTDDANIPIGTSTTINWSTRNVAPGSCVASGAWSGSKTDGENQSGSSGNLSNLENYLILTCDSGTPIEYPNPATAQVLVNVEKLTLSLTLESENIPFADPTVLNYVSTYANTCIPSDGAGTTWPGTTIGTVTDQEYSETIYAGSGTSTEALPPGTYQFTLTCNGNSGQQETASALLKIGRNPNFSEQIGNDPDVNEQ